MMTDSIMYTWKGQEEMSDSSPLSPSNILLVRLTDYTKLEARGPRSPGDAVTGVSLSNRGGKRIAKY